MTMCRSIATRMDNPFSTRHVRPGQLPPLDATGRPVDLASVVKTLADLGGDGALVGRHGSGKTNLLWALADVLERGGRRIERIRLRDPRSFLSLIRAVSRGARGGTVCVDSWECLGRVGTGALRLIAWLCGTRLLVTAHEPGELPTLCSCTTSPGLLTHVVAQLHARWDGPWFMAEHDLETAFVRASGDLREALFQLYDLHEERMRATVATGIRCPPEVTVVTAVGDVPVVTASG